MSDDMPAVDILVVAPHCDDEVLGCGGLLAKHGARAGVLFVSSPDRDREKEAELAQQILGYQGTWWGGLPDGYLDTDMHQLVGVIDTVLADARPSAMYIPWAGSHQDHVAVHQAGIRAARLSMTPGHHYVPNVYAYEVAAYDIDLSPSNLLFNVFEPLTEEQVDRKVDALKAYASQAIEGPHPANGLKAMAQTAGQARAVGYAEQYALVRRVRS